MTHAPVMLTEVLEALAPKAGETLLDGTFGGGGYTVGILNAALCKVIAIDRDPDAIARAQPLAERFQGRLKVVEGRFSELADHANGGLDGVVLDVGVSSYQLDEAARGFSFRYDAPIDMRMSKHGPSAADAVNRLSEAALADAIFHLGEDGDSRRIARALVRARAEAPITTTVRLAQLVEDAVGGRRGAKTHPATRTFQALRILVNNELGELVAGLEAAEAALSPGGRLVVVAFHSLEDRLVKTFLTARSQAGPAGNRYAPAPEPGPAPSFRLIQRRAQTATEAETDLNPRARSASLRAAVRTPAPAHQSGPPQRFAPLAEAEWERLK